MLVFFLFFFRQVVVAFVIFRIVVPVVSLGHTVKIKKGRLSIYW